MNTAFSFVVSYTLYAKAWGIGNTHHNLTCAITNNLSGGYFRVADAAPGGVTAWGGIGTIFALGV